MAEKDNEGTWLNVGSGVSLFDGKPYVELVVGEENVQMRPKKAREVAMMLLESAEAAVQDAVLAEFGKEEIGGDEEAGARLVMMLRERREKFDDAD